MPQLFLPTKIRIASDNQLKFDSTDFTSNVLGWNVPINRCPVDLPNVEGLDVNEQPEDAQTELYADLRTYMMRVKYGPIDELTLDIGLESGLYNFSTGPMDITIASLTFLNQTWRKRSYAVRMNPNYVKEARERGFKTTTHGMVYAEHHPGVDKGDWHIHYVGISRKQQIVDLLLRSIQERFLV